MAALQLCGAEKAPGPFLAAPSGWQMVQLKERQPRRRSQNLWHRSVMDVGVGWDSRICFIIIILLWFSIRVWSNTSMRRSIPKLFLTSNYKDLTT